MADKTNNNYSGTIGSSNDPICLSDDSFEECKESIGVVEPSRKRFKFNFKEEKDITEPPDSGKYSKHMFFILFLKQCFKHIIPPKVEILICTIKYITFTNVNYNIYHFVTLKSS